MQFRRLSGNKKFGTRLQKILNQKETSLESDVPTGYQRLTLMNFKIFGN